MPARGSSWPLLKVAWAPENWPSTGGQGSAARTGKAAQVPQKARSSASRRSEERMTMGRFIADVRLNALLHRLVRIAAPAGMVIASRNHQRMARAADVDRIAVAAEGCAMSVASPALPARAERLWAALLAATLMNLPLGSVYAFSVLLRPIEQELAISRSALSLVFGLATAGFTVGSVGAAFLYRVAPAPILVLLSALVAAAGIATAAAASGLAQLLVGYGIVFGTGGGVAYILLQQGVNMLVRRRQGLVNGYIVSLYPMGAMIATPAFHACNETFGWRTTLGGLATVLVACGIAAALLAWHGGARLVAPKSNEETQPGTLGLT